MKLLKRVGLVALVAAAVYYLWWDFNQEPDGPSEYDRDIC